MIKIAINGFGRIGRPTLRRILDNHPNLEVVAINDLTDTKTLAHLLKYDSIYGRYNGEVSFTDKSLIVDGKEIKVFAEKEPEKLPWKKLEINIVLECTGQFTDVDGAEKHLKAGAKQVIISAPAKEGEARQGRPAKEGEARQGRPAKEGEARQGRPGKDSIPSYILGVNAEKFDPKKDKIVDMGSCTTNCIAPVAKVLNDNFKIVRGFMTTIHSYTNDQRILDLPHKDLRRARAAAFNIIPTSTGAAKALGKVIPELKGKIDGIAMRVPTPTVSTIDLIIELEKSATVEEINNVFKNASKTKELQGILATTEEELVSSDFIGNTYSAVVDLPLTMANGNIIKVVAWYDNEYAYACRLAEFAEYVGKKI